MSGVKVALALAAFVLQLHAEISRQTVIVPMRDGVGLATDIYRIPGGTKNPVLLLRTPYNKAGSQTTAERYAKEGYTVVVQDCRGRYASAGAFVPYNNEGQDGYDTLDWIKAQTWSEGRVGMWGASYVGAAQWQAAAEDAPGLTVLAPTATSLFEPPKGVSPPADWGTTWLHLPVSRMDQAIGWDIPWLSGILAHNRPDGYWKRLDLTRDVEKLSIPAQHVVGYYDFFCREVVSIFQRLRNNRENQQLILGPWDHGTIGKSKVGDVDFGKEAQLDLAQENLLWFDRFLKGRASEPFAPVRYFSMGDNRWLTAQTWPPSGAAFTSFYLHSVGRANPRDGSGALNRTTPIREERADMFQADPANPVPSVPRAGNSAVWGPVDQNAGPDREDVLKYTSAVLTAPLTFAGPIRAEIYSFADTRDADWVVKLIDLQPSGFAQSLAVGVLRGSFRDGASKHTLLVPGRVYPLNIDLGHVAAHLDRNHRLRIEISGSNFPLYDRNTNTGEGPTGSNMTISHQTILHSQKSPSRIILPVLTAGSR